MKTLQSQRTQSVATRFLSRFRERAYLSCRLRETPLPHALTFLSHSGWKKSTSRELLAGYLNSLSVAPFGRSDDENGLFRVSINHFDVFPPATFWRFLLQEKGWKYADHPDAHRFLIRSYLHKWQAEFTVCSDELPLLLNWVLMAAELNDSGQVENIPAVFGLSEISGYLWSRRAAELSK